MENNKPTKNTLLTQNIVYCTTLYLAAQNGHKDIVKYISELPIDTVGRGLSEFTKIFLGAQNGGFRGVKQAIENMFLEIENDSDVTCSEEEEEAESKLDTSLCSTIHEAAELGAENYMKSFIATADSIDVEDNEGFTALHVAAKNGKSECIEILIQEGASIDYKIKDDNFNESNRGKTALHIACEYGRIRGVSKLLSHGADPELTDCKGNVPLYYAVKHGSKSIVQLLLDKGVNINTLNNEEHMVITEARNENVINVLLKNGINYKNINKKHGASILHNATFFDNDFLVNFLLENKIRINIEQKENVGYSPFLYPAYFNKCKIMKTLKYGANINSIINTGCNALHVGALGGSTEAIQLLLEKEFNVNATTRTTKRTSLILAVIKNKPEAITLLLLHGADVKIKDSTNKSALNYAIENKNQEIIKMLRNHYK